MRKIFLVLSVLVFVSGCAGEARDASKNLFDAYQRVTSTNQAVEDGSK